MLLERPSSLEESWLGVFQKRGRPQALLAGTFAFDAEFFSTLLVRVAEAACEGVAGDGESLANLPVDVVCDRTRYVGHRVGFNVTLWPKSTRLFHPKLLVALFHDEVVWSDGSLNLTAAGWHRNREVAMLHAPGDRTLPRELRELLEALPGVAAARRILEATGNARTRQLPGTYVTSLHEPIGPRFLASAPRAAEEVHLVAPFFEPAEADGAPIDEGWLQLLGRRYPDARFHVYLPRLTPDPLCVQGSRRLFVALERQLTHPIALHPVAPAPGPLHGKVACIVESTRRGGYAHTLVGSPNMTQAALMAKRGRGNVETAWIVDERWHQTRRIFRDLAAPTCSIRDARFAEPVINRVTTWMPLCAASYDPRRRQLRVEWSDPADRANTVLLYAGQELVLERDACRDFALVEGLSFLVTRHRKRTARDGCCPIDIPVALLRACEGGAPERTPEQWLKMLGASQPLGGEVAGHAAGGTDEGATEPGRGFKWSARVRDLAARMSYLEEKLADEHTGAIDRQWLEELLQQIYVAHDPAATGDTREQVWRAWVRLELWQAAEGLATGAHPRGERARWEKRCARLRRGIGGSRLAPTVRSQLRKAIRALGRLS